MDPTFQRVLLVGGLLFGGGYLVVTRRRSRRAAVVGLCGIGLAAARLAMLAAGVSVADLFAAVGVADRAVLVRCRYWGGSALMAAAHGLLVWAVLVDRPRPPADAD